MIRRVLKEKLKEASQSLGFAQIEPQVLPTTDPSFGDYYTNIAFVLAKRKGKQTPYETAKFFEGKLTGNEDIFVARPAGNGLINFTISPKFIQNYLRKIIKEKNDFGRVEVGKGKKARVEFVSANPTGPLHIGNARGGPLGDTISSVLEFAGYKVLREYLDNDRGAQVKELGWTVASKAGLVKQTGKLAYEAPYTDELAKTVKKEIGNTQGLNEEEMAEKAGEVSVKVLFKDILSDLEKIGIKYDRLVHESDLQKKLPPILKDLEEAGLLKKHEGAVWFAPKNSKGQAEDQGWVVIKKDGSYTYFAADIAYHKEKFQSGYDLVIDVFGSNTLGHVPKLKALTSLFGFDIEKLKVIIYQFVRVKRGREIVRMSKRAGSFVTAAQVLNEVEKDAFRFFLLMHEPSTHMDFDLELAKKESNENPVYYAQYAYARANSILKKAQEAGLEDKKYGSTSLSLIKGGSEINLMKKIIKFPELVEDISGNFAVHLLPKYVIEVADLFHKFYEFERVVDKNNPEISRARLVLVTCVRIVLGNCLKLMGISAPERMERVNDKA